MARKVRAQWKPSKAVEGVGAAAEEAAVEAEEEAFIAAAAGLLTVEEAAALQRAEVDTTGVTVTVPAEAAPAWRRR